MPQHYTMTIYLYGSSVSNMISIQRMVDPATGQETTQSVNSRQISYRTVSHREVSVQRSSPTRLSTSQGAAERLAHIIANTRSDALRVVVHQRDAYNNINQVGNTPIIELNHLASSTSSGGPVTRAVRESHVQYRIPCENGNIEFSLLPEPRPITTANSERWEEGNHVHKFLRRLTEVHWCSTEPLPDATMAFQGMDDTGSQDTMHPLEGQGARSSTALFSRVLQRVQRMEAELPGSSDEASDGQGTA